ncbi:hypothetical protein TRFO_08719 [Tritrichomonas foetus]|uniref:Uncharacterized protein n=1 Tax=Tritrichomonas foetus TaxID=1144522 RepID=A0A1J4JN89_9EUKA|nr:hypothetical protein TRFO_08719 [Tritrichomonas foetus]|eukprot:OHS98724.1 hypothetical protein TRFO_08719 [Tritrichomonas foetus]
MIYNHISLFQLIFFTFKIFTSKDLKAMLNLILIFLIVLITILIVYVNKNDSAIIRFFERKSEDQFIFNSTPFSTHVSSRSPSPSPVIKERVKFGLSKHISSVKSNQNGNFSILMNQSPVHFQPKDSTKDEIIAPKTLFQNNIEPRYYREESPSYDLIFDNSKEKAKYSSVPEYKNTRINTVPDNSQQSNSFSKGNELCHNRLHLHNKNLPTNPILRKKMNHYMQNENQSTFVNSSYFTNF